MTREQFRAMGNVTYPRKWKTINQENSKEYQSRVQEKLARNWNPTEKPPLSSGAHKRGNGWIARSGDQVALAIKGQTWSKFSLDQTPLKNARSFAVYDSQPDVFVFVAGRDRYIYYPSAVEVLVPENDLGDMDKPGLTSLLKYETNPPNQKLHVRYRIADDPWSKWQAADESVLIRGVAKKGKHSLSVEFNFDNHLCRSQKRTYEFTTTYSMQEEIDEQVALLGANTFAERESAMKKLIEFGPAVLPTIENLVKSQDIETKTRAQKIGKAIKANLNQ